MNTNGEIVSRFALLAVMIATLVPLPARAQFTPGHIFAAEPASKRCQHNGEFRWDRIWEIDPQTGESWVFKELSDEWCGGAYGLAFTLDGTRLLVNQRFKSRVLSLDSEGNAEILYDENDGIVGPIGSNCIAFDAKGGLFVANEADIIRFPPGGGPDELFADGTDGLGIASGPIVIAADGDLYFGNHFGAFNNLLRFRGAHEGSVFDSYGFNEDVITLTNDSCGHVFAGMETGEIFAYDAGVPASRRLLFHDTGQIRLAFSLAMSPDEQGLWIVGIGGGSSMGAWALDIRDGSLSVIAEIADAGAIYAGIAIVAVPVTYGDIDRDGTINLADLSKFVGEYEGVRESRLMPCSPADLNHDGTVDLRDVALFWATPLSN